MNLAEAIRRAIPVLVQYGTVDEPILVAWLTRAGLTMIEAEDAVRFIPLAFAREILKGSGVTLSDTYIRMRKDGTQEERPLKNEKFFSGAAFLAPQIITELGSEAFTAIVCLSPEFDAVNQALNAGSAPEDLIASPPVVSWPERAPEPEKPWWKFWA